jgi:hypothetical protein
VLGKVARTVSTFVTSVATIYAVVYLIDRSNDYSRYLWDPNELAFAFFGALMATIILRMKLWLD